MLNSSKIMFLIIMIMGTFIVTSSTTWLSMWIGLEMNLMAFIPIIYKQNNPQTSESCMIYFLIQSMGSIIMLTTILMMTLIYTQPKFTEIILYTIMTTSMMIKLGIPPFHFWFPEIMNKMDWINCLILMTWQKIAPLSIMSNLMDKNYILPIMIIALSTITGAIGGLSQTSIRKIMAYSSINHMGWMIACMNFNQLWTEYLIIYSIIVMMMTAIFMLNSSFFMNQLNNKSPSIQKYAIMITFMSLGGLPPFLGFLPKWMVIKSMIIAQSYSILIVMIMSALITLFYYLRLTSHIFLLNNSSTKYNWKNSQKNMLILSFIVAFNIILPMTAIFSF
uniref:NADH dehydrogenase subunit 2 n=1 Tax=Lisarda rhypara TaxID=204544 RepID=UPI0028D1BF5F|nr:NADH dehydrogenase subunit 2 [Lisarda rhypara]WMV02025.1 NADH dehydrogenase subunit 2 [Lisarda rhypara]